MSDSVSSTEVPINWVLENKRLDASYYSQDGIEARVLLDELSDDGVQLENLGTFTEDIFKKVDLKEITLSKAKEVSPT